MGSRLRARASRYAFAALLASLTSGCFLIGYEGVGQEPEELPNVLDPDLDASLGDGSTAGDGDSDGGGSDLDASDADASDRMLDDGSVSVRDAQVRDAQVLVDGGDGDAGDGDGDTGDGDGGDGDVTPEPDGGTKADGGTLPGGDPHDDPWWNNTPPTQACGNLPNCNQTCTSATTPCDFECAKLSCIPNCQAGTKCHSWCKSTSTSCVATCGAGANCVHECDSLYNCTGTCAAGSTCDMDCTGTTACTVTCEKGAHCIAHCGGNVSCEMVCEGVEMTCPDGTVTCDHLCP